MARRGGFGVMAGFVLACCALVTLLSFLGRVGWGFELFSHFHLQYAIGLAAVVILFAASRAWLPMVGALLLLSPHLVCLSYYAPVRKPMTAGESAALSVVAFNLLTQNQRHGEVLRFLQESDADILLLIEVNEDWLVALRPLEASHPHFRQVPRPDNFGMAIYSRFPIGRFDAKATASELPCMLARIDWNGRPLTVIGAHPLPPIGGRGSGLRDDYLAQLGKLAGEAAADSEVIVLGDLNTTPWAPGFGDLMRSGGLLDSGKHRGFQSTWRRLNPVFSLPLDHILHSPGLETVDREVGPELGSDHRPVRAVLRGRKVD